jgi:hypothetical protein
MANLFAMAGYLRALLLRVEAAACTRIPLLRPHHP